LAFHSGREADHSPPSSAGVREWVDLYIHFPMRDTGHSLPSNAEVKNVGSHASVLPYVFMA
jgi:hypothetical protein